jgi:SecD/SecF fusion protein
MLLKTNILFPRATLIVVLFSLATCLAACKGLSSKLKQQLASSSAKSYTVKVNLQAGVDSLPPGEREVAMKQLGKLLLKRMDLAGAKIESEFLNASTGAISLTLSGVTDTVYTPLLLSTAGHLGFYDTYEIREVSQVLTDVNTKTLARPGLITKADPQPEGPNSVASQQLFGDAKPKPDTIQLFQLLYPNLGSNGQSWGEGPMVGYVLGKDILAVDKVFKQPEIKAMLPRDLRLMWGVHSMKTNEDVYILYAVKAGPAGAPVTGKSIQDVYASHDNLEKPMISLQLNPESAPVWEDMTAVAAAAMVEGRPVKKSIAITMDDKVYSAPRVMQRITQGHSQITGMEDMNECDFLVNLIKSGELPVPVRAVSVTVN